MVDSSIPISNFFIEDFMKIVEFVEDHKSELPELNSDTIQME